MVISATVAELYVNAVWPEQAKKRKTYDLFQGCVDKTQSNLMQKLSVS